MKNPSSRCAARRAAIAAALILAVGQASIGHAQRYPSKPVRYLVPDAAGSGSDTIARLLAAGLATVTGQQMVVDNRPGATSTIGTDLAAKAPADGYTVLQISSALAAAVGIYRSLPFELARDFAPVTQIAAAPQVVTVHPSLPVKSMIELAKLAKARPDAIVYGSAGSGSSTHIAAELFKAQSGSSLLHVPYRGGGPAITAVISGETSVYFAPVAASLGHIRSGRLRALAVTTARRIDLLADLPTVAESGFPGYHAAQWYGALVPVKTPRETVLVLRDAIGAALANATVNRQLVDAGYIVIGDQPEAFGAQLKSEVARLGALVRKLGLTAN